MQLGHDQFNTGNAFLRVDVHGHSPAVVRYNDPVVLGQGDINACGKACNGLIHTVVNNLKGQVVRA